MIKAIAEKHIIVLASINVSLVSAVIAEIQLTPHSKVSNKLNRFFM
jgi:hypothetical protein